MNMGQKKYNNDASDSNKILRENIVDKVGDVKIYGQGFSGGKGYGLIKINEHHIPRVHQLRTRILTTSYYDRYLKNGGTFNNNDLETIKDILSKLGEIPISIRSSATNEAFVSRDDVSVHAGENTSFMLPNNHPDLSIRFRQFIQAIDNIYSDFKMKQDSNSREKMAIVINPIPGMSWKSLAGPVYCPLVSGVANSFFPYALKSQVANEGFARLAFGHGYATVLDDFPVISMATIKNPIPVKFMGEGQKFFYAIDMTKNSSLRGDEMETMRRLHIRFADYHTTKALGREKKWITLEALVQDDMYEFRTGLIEIMEAITSKVMPHFQIEFVFNVEHLKDIKRNGTFHVVQLTPLPKMTFEKVRIPDKVKKTYLSLQNLQGHGMKKNVECAVVVSPFLYKKEMHDDVVAKLSEFSCALKNQGKSYIIIVPGRLGTKNRNWGIQVEFENVGSPSAIFEYGVDIAARSEPVHDTLTGGGIYGSHFLYMIQGGFDEEQKRLRTRMFGTQGTHFLTNLMSNRVIYGYIAPLEDHIDPWFFSSPETNSPIFIRKFPTPVNIYADSNKQKCVIVSEK